MVGVLRGGERKNCIVSEGRREMCIFSKNLLCLLLMRNLLPGEVAEEPNAYLDIQNLLSAEQKGRWKGN